MFPIPGPDLFHTFSVLDNKTLPAGMPTFLPAYVMVGRYLVYSLELARLIDRVHHLTYPVYPILDNSLIWHIIPYKGIIYAKG